LQILGSKFWSLGGLNQHVRKHFCRVPHGEMTAKNWLDSIEKQKKRIDLKKQRDKQTDGRTDRDNDKRDQYKTCDKTKL